MQSTPVEMESSSSAPRYGLLAAEMRDHVYFPAEGGHLYTCPYLRANLVAPFTCVIYLTACRGLCELQVAERRYPVAAAAVKPIARSIDCHGAHLLMFHLNPLHPRYRAIQRLRHPGIGLLDRGAFAALDSKLEAAYIGELAVEDVTELFDTVVAIAVAQLPPMKPPSERAEALMASMRRHPQRSLDSIALEFDLSYEAMSRVFKEAIGLSLRQYQLWLKLDNVRYVYRPEKTLTQIAHDAGFSDLAHMTRIFQRAYGAPPSYFLRNSRVHCFAPSHRRARQLA